MCVFCDPENIQKFLIIETEYSRVIYNRYPLGEGHFLIIPKAHILFLSDLSDEGRVDFFSLLSDLAKRLRSSFCPEGFNILINEGKVAGQTIDHLHAHLICRKTGDGIQNFGKSDTGRLEATLEDITHFRDLLGVIP